MSYWRFWIILGSNKNIVNKMINNNKNNTDQFVLFRWFKLPICQSWTCHHFYMAIVFWDGACDNVVSQMLVGHQGTCVGIGHGSLKLPKVCLDELVKKYLKWMILPNCLLSSQEGQDKVGQNAQWWMHHYQLWNSNMWHQLKGQILL